LSVQLYMDENVRRAVTAGLRLRGIDVITAQEDGSATLDDPKLMDRATELRRVMFSQDFDMLAEAARRQRSGEFFSGLIYAHQMGPGVGRCVADLELIAKCCTSDEFKHYVEYLPL